MQGGFCGSGVTLVVGLPFFVGLALCFVFVGPIGVLLCSRLLCPSLCPSLALWLIGGTLPYVGWAIVL